jgi:outer membrane receptor protein involved in Fe transport
MYTDDANTDGESIDQNAILSGKIWRNFDFISEYGRNVEMSLAVDNILGFRYINSRNSNSMNMGRTFYLELTCKF